VNIEVLSNTKGEIKIIIDNSKLHEDLDKE